MRARLTPPKELLHDLFIYDGVAGALYWRFRPENHFKTKAAWGRHLSQFAGKQAGNLRSAPRTTYRSVSIHGTNWLAHRIIYFMFSDGDSSLDIDHIDGNGLNNRLDNLRLVNRESNSKNSKKPRNNTSGVVGVWRLKTIGLWRAQITSNGKSRVIGQYGDWFDAVCARKSAEVKCGFHKNHGR